MSPILFHVWGPLSVHAYGFCIAIGALITFTLAYYDKVIKKIAPESIRAVPMQLTLIMGYFGGRIAIMLSEPEAMKDPLFLFKFWEPGLSVLGALIAVVASLALYFYIKKIPMLIFLDRIALYAPFTHIFGRIGCFFAGCCYGIPSTSWFSVTYTDPLHMAPLNCSLHPTQLYSSLVYVGIFLFLYFIQQRRSYKPGTIIFSYVGLIAIERFLIDFMRWDRIFIAHPEFLQLFSVHQWIALTLSCAATIGIIFIHNRKQ